MDEEKFIDPRYLEELRKYSASGHKDNDDAMALTMAGQAVFHPDSPFVSIESRSHVNTMPEMPHDDAQDDAVSLAMAGERYRKEFEMQPVLDGPLPKFCIAHHCTERGPKCDKCAYTAFSSSHRRWLEEKS